MLRSGEKQKDSEAGIKEVKSIKFGLFNPKEIEEMAVCKISLDEGGNENSGNINDLKMGPIDYDIYNKAKCSTCNCDLYECPGHFGYIHLEKPVFHVGYIKECANLLNSICSNCGEILIDNYEQYEQINKIKDPKVRQSKIYNLCKNILFCNERIPRDGSLTNKEKKNSKFYKKGCQTEQIKYKVDNLKIIKKDQKSNKDNTTELKIISPEEVIKIFDKIADKNLELLGFNLTFINPKSMIIQNLAVCPPQIRPSVSFSSLISQDDLTLQYNQILNANSKLKKEIDKGATLTTIQSNFDILQANVAGLINNEISSNKVLKNGIPIKTLTNRLKGKEGRIRGNLMGKRVDFSARSVISPDPNLEVDQIGVPLSIAMNLTFPEKVIINEVKNGDKDRQEVSNKDKLEKLIKNGYDKYPGATTIIKKNGKIIHLKRCKNKSFIKLENGDIVLRHMLDGDYVVFNRQPSLHKMSMMGHRVKILPYFSFRLNLSVTTPYNADFDGDEMNLHFPQSLEVKSEIKNIMHVSNQMVSPQSNSPVMGIVQDTLIGCKIFTARDNFLTYEQVMNLLIWIDGFDLTKIPKPCIIKPKNLWSGKQIFSLIFPENLNYPGNKKDISDNLNLLDNYVEIRKGELITGIINKKTVGTSNKGIINSIWKDVNENEGEEDNSPYLRAMKFLGNCQKLINNFLLLTGWTIGISDIICNEETNIKNKEILTEMKNNIDNYLQQAKLGTLQSKPGKNMVDSFELKANQELYNASNEAGRFVQDSLSEKNHFKNMVSAGSKGKITNISQIMAFVGQQNVNGKRIPFYFSKRTLPHFLKDDYSPESKGFVESSFIKGLNPQEFFFHAMGGREGIIDTAIKTAETGYSERKLVKLLEDLMVSYDETVRNSEGEIIQFLYGEDGIAGEYIESQEFETLKMDDETLSKKFKFFENAPNNISFDILNKYMKKEIIENLKKIKLADLKSRLDKEFEIIKNNRDYMRKNILTFIDDSINIPVNINEIITKYKSKFNINNYSKSDLNPLNVLERVDKLKNELKAIIYHRNNQLNLDDDSNEGIFYMVLNYSLSTKNIIINHRLNKDAFEEICKKIKSKFEKAKVTPGEMVGSIASQSIGEPATQMTLNTFHLAGVSSVNVTLGVPRLKEILNLTKNIKTSSMTIYLKEKEGGYNNDDIYNLIAKMQYTTLLDILIKSEIYYDPDIKNSLFEKDKEIIDRYMLIEKEEIENENISGWVLRLVINTNKITINISDITKIIQHKIKNILIINNLESEDRKEILIRLKCTKDMDPKDREKTKSYEYLKLLEGYLLNLKISGIESVKKVYWKEEAKVKYAEKQEYKIEEEKVLETEGINLLKIFEIKEVDFKRTISNDIYEIFNTLGIEATRKVIIEEIRKVLLAYGIYINYRHLALLSDLMTHRGFLTSITRFGLKKTNYGPIRKATFEETVNTFLEAAIFNRKDKLKGISEKILLGKDGKFGTDCFDILNPDDLEDKSQNLIDGEILGTPYQRNSPDNNNSNKSNDKSNPDENNLFFGPETNDYNPSIQHSSYNKGKKNNKSAKSKDNKNNNYDPLLGQTYNSLNKYNESSNLYSQQAQRTEYNPENPPIPNLECSSPFYESPQPQDISGTAGFFSKDQNKRNLSQYAPSLPQNIGEELNKQKNNNATPFIQKDKNDDEEDEEEEEENNNK